MKIITKEILNSTNLKAFKFCANDRITFKFVDDEIEKTWQQDKNAHERSFLIIPVIVENADNTKLNSTFAQLIISCNLDLSNTYSMMLSTITSLISIVKLTKQKIEEGKESEQ